MDTSKIIKGVVNSGRYTVTAPIIKEDYGLYLQIEGVELPQTYEVDFSNDEHHGTSVTMIGNADGVLIPHQFIDTGKDIFAFLYHVGANYGRTVYKFRIPNKVRPDRTNEEPTPEEQSTIDQAISALNEAVAQTAEDRENADASAQSAYESADEAQQARDNAQTYANNASASATSASQNAQASANSATASAQSASEAQTASTNAETYALNSGNKAVESAQSASASANSASQAQGFANSATASAQSASGYASQAQTSAQTASSKAAEASTSAQTASTKASEANQSAVNASASASQAESAKTASQTAQGLAESARDSAQGYAEDAQGYAEDAQASAESISASASQIAQNTADILKAFPTDTASGAVASFSDGADNIPLKSLIVNIDPVQDLSQGDPSPENICPISGWTQVDVEQSGVNVWDEEWEVGGYASSNGEPWNTNTRIRSKTNKYIPVKPNTTYYLNMPTGNVMYCDIMFYNADKTYISRTNPNAGTTFTTPSDARFIRFATGAAYGTTYNHDISINYPSTDHDYHPYTGRSIPISWQTEAGTVYGGKLDVLSGVMTVEMAGIQIRDTSWTTPSTNVFKTELDKKIDMLTIPMSDAYKSVNPVSVVANLPNDSISVHRYWDETNYRKIVYIKDTRYTTVEEFVEAMGEHQIVYALNTPIEIQLTPYEVKSLLGVNNIWADTGDCSVEYRADTRLYIEKLTQPTEDDMVANSAITSGQFFMIGNSLYRALTAIASGATITVDTNAQRVSLSDALNLVNA